MACRGFLQCLLKLFNFALALVGVLLIVYSVSRLIHLDPDLRSNSIGSFSHQTTPHSLSSPLPPLTLFSLAASSNQSDPSDSFPRISLKPRSALAGHDGTAAGVSGAPQHMVGGRSGKDAVGDFRLPDLWFIYFLLGVGCLLTLTTIIGAIAAETNSSCCLSCYQFGLCLLLVIQGVAAALVWLQDVPQDPTGEFDRESAFVRSNADLCRLAGVSMLLVEGTVLLLAMMLRALQDESAHADDDDDYILPHSSRLRQPFLRQSHASPYGGMGVGAATGMGGGGGTGNPAAPGLSGSVPPSGAAAGAAGGGYPAGSTGQPLSDAWRNRILEKYGLDTNEFHHNTPGNHMHQAQQQQQQQQQSSGGCSIM